MKRKITNILIFIIFLFLCWGAFKLNCKSNILWKEAEFFHNLNYGGE
jgi:hypothetical protein